MHVFVSAGEPSGDLHGANLVKSLRKFDPSVKCVGFGGDRMADAGCDLLYPLCNLSVMWFAQAIANALRFIRLLKQAENYFRDERPDALVMIDFPGFHWKLAERAKKHGVPVYFFVPPQIWAWAQWRAKKMKRLVDHVFSALPFEHDWFAERGISSEYVGHPYFDELATRPIGREFVAAERSKPGRIVGILPGSRMQEVKRNLDEMLRAAAAVRTHVPDARFLVASFNDAQAAVARELVAHAGVPAEVLVGRTPEIIELAEACVAVSGSVSLEMMTALTPAAIVYRLTTRLSLALGRYMKKVKYITLVNLLADEELYPEFLTSHDPSGGVSKRIVEWLRDPAAVAALQAKLMRVRDSVAVPGACDIAARRILAGAAGARRLAA